MNLSPLTLRKLCDELRPQIDHRLIRDVYLVGQYDLYFYLGDAGYLLLSAHPGRSCLMLTQLPDDTQRVRIPWADRYLRGGGIIGIDHIPHERIVHLVVRKRDRIGTATDSRIICELINRYANVVLVDMRTEQILGSLRSIRARQNRVREISPGKIYQPPPALDRAPPESADVQSLSFLIDIPEDARADALVQHIAGLDLLSARELLHIAGFGEKRSLFASDLANFVEIIRAFFAKPPFYDGGLRVREGDNRNAVCALDIRHTQVEQRYDTLSEAISDVVACEVQSEALKGRKKNIEKDLKNRLSVCERKIGRIRADIDDADNADLYEKMGNVLMCHIAQIPPNVDTITLPDVFDPSCEDMDISLNPRRTASENASAYLKRAQKARKGAPILAKRLVAAQREKDEIQQYIDRLNTVRSEAEFDEIRRELEDARLIKAPKKRPQVRSKRQSGDIHPRRYRTQDGWRVLVGRNNAENDRLTKSSGRDDLFLHVHGCPGSHVILKRDGKADRPSRKTLEEAASLAAYWSKARGAQSVPVNYTEVRYVRKPRGAPPGLVTIRNEKTVMVSPRELKREDE
jgi:predicted ribosome quality control (RQC) complex YloA/Tae2 family protein